jgi:cell division protein ZapA
MKGKDGPSSKVEVVAVDKNRIKIQIQGETFTVKGSLDPAYASRLAGHVDKKLQQIREQQPNLNPVKMLMLACLNLADEVFKLQDELSEMEALFNEKDS